MAINEPLAQFGSEKYEASRMRQFVAAVERLFFKAQGRIRDLEGVAPAGTISASAATSYQITSVDYLVNIDATAGAATPLMELDPKAKREVTVRKTDVSGNTVTPNGNGKNINGASSDPTAISAQYAATTYIYDGVEWVVKSRA